MHEEKEKVAGLHSGLRVSDNLRLVRPLGGGGMGRVWVAHNQMLAADVAIKFIDPEVATKVPAAMKRFRREAHLMANVRSPHVVQTFDHGVMGDGTPYIVMELLEGEDLEGRLERAGPLSLAEVSILVAQVAEVLTRAHELGVVHRDIKPANLFLIKSSYPIYVKVLDFGIAKPPPTLDASAVTATGEVMGTPAYMSPEVLTAPENANAQVDMWALAVTAYQALTGRMPFWSISIGTMCRLIALGQFTPASEARPGLSNTLDAWFARAFAVDPSARFRSAESMAAHLRAHAGPVDELLSKPPDSFFDPALAPTLALEDEASVAEAMDRPAQADPSPPPSVVHPVDLPMHSQWPLKLLIAVAVVAALAAGLLLALGS